MNHKYKSLIKDTFVFSLGKFGSKMVLFFLVPLYTNYLSKPEYGTAELVFTISQLLMPLFSLVVFDSVIRFGLMKGVKRENVLRNAFFVLGITIVATGVATPLFSVYNGISEWKLYLSIMIVLAAVMDVEMNYLKIKGKNLTFSIISIVQALVLAGSNILLLACLSFGIEGYLLSTIISYACCVVLAFLVGGVLSDLRKSEFDKTLLKEMLFFSVPLIMNNISWWVIQSSDKLMVEGMISAAALGLYTAAAKIPSLINVVVSVFQQAWGISSIKEIESSKDTRFFSGVFKVYSIGVFICCILLNTIVKPFMMVYVGKEFVDSWRYVPLLVASAGFSAISAYYGSLYSALKKSINNMITTVIAAVANLVINLLFIQVCGVWGAIIGTVAAYIIIAYLRMYDISKYIKLDYSVFRFVINSLLVLGQAIIVSIDFYPIELSCIILVVYLIYNHKTVRNLIKKDKRQLSSNSLYEDGKNE